MSTGKRLQLCHCGPRECIHPSYLRDGYICKLVAQAKQANRMTRAVDAVDPHEGSTPVCPRATDRDLDRLTTENTRLRSILTYIATYPIEDGYKAAFYGLRQYARTALTGEVAQTRKGKR